MSVPFFPLFLFCYLTYSFNAFVLKFSSPICDVGINPGFAFIKSGNLFTIVAHVNSTVAGLATVIVVSGSPYTVHSFLSKSSLEYTLPDAFRFYCYSFFCFCCNYRTHSCCITCFNYFSKCIRINIFFMCCRNCYLCL